MGTKLIDQFSLLHFATGIIFYFFGVTLKTSIILHIIFELVENSKYGMAFITKLTFWPGGKKQADSLTNSLSDIIFFAIGWQIACVVDNYMKVSNQLKTSTTQF